MVSSPSEGTKYIPLTSSGTDSNRQILRGPYASSHIVPSNNRCTCGSYSFSRNMTHTLSPP